MARPHLEVADVLNQHGDAYVARHRGHLSRGQLKVISAIRACRTPALGGHVARCETCDHVAIAYNSCRNRHCPTTPAAIGTARSARANPRGPGSPSGKPTCCPCPITTWS